MRSIVKHTVKDKRHDPFGRLGFAGVPILNRAIRRAQNVGQFFEIKSGLLAGVFFSVGVNHFDQLQRLDFNLVERRR